MGQLSPDDDDRQWTARVYVPAGPSIGGPYREPALGVADDRELLTSQRNEKFRAATDAITRARMAADSLKHLSELATSVRASGFSHAKLEGLLRAQRTMAADALVDEQCRVNSLSAEVDELNARLNVATQVSTGADTFCEVVKR